MVVLIAVVKPSMRLLVSGHGLNPAAARSRARFAIQRQPRALLGRRTGAFLGRCRALVVQCGKNSCRSFVTDKPTSLILVQVFLGPSCPRPFR